MPIAVEWYNEEQQAVIQRFDGNWNWPDLSESLVLINQLSEGRPMPLLIDMSNTKIIPAGNVLLQTKSVSMKAPEHITHLILVIDSHLIKTFINIIFNVIPSWRSRTQFARTAEEGCKLVDKIIAEQATGVQ